MRSAHDLRPRRRVVGAGSDDGVVGVITAILVLVLIVLVAMAVDTGRWYVEAQRVQNAADASALGGVVYLRPGDTSSYTEANTEALNVASSNGMPNSGSSTVQTYTIPGKPTQLGVTVTNRISNTFGRIFGNPDITISRSAVADYQSASLMGSPCNAFGGQPPSNTNAAPPSSGTVIPPSPPGHATCQTPAEYWALLEGPTENKINGDRYATINCSSGVDYCSGGTNDEYREENYFWVLRVQDAAANKPITVELYDPGYINTGSTCGDLPNSIPSSPNPTNPYATSADAASRYDDTANQYCPGDNGASNNNAMTVSVVLRGQSEDLNPLEADALPGCAAQFRGRTGSVSTNNLTAGASGYLGDSFAKVFHQWVTLCTFNPADYGGAGDYYLQVRSNVALASGTSSSTYMVQNNSIGEPNTRYVSSLADTVMAPTGNERGTNGINGFAIRAAVWTDDTKTTLDQTAAANVAVSGYERMPIWVNSSGSTATFNLIQVPSNATGKSFTFSLFDLGDARGGGTIRINPPSGNTIQGTCTVVAPGGSPANLSNCTLPFTNQQFNGKLRTISVPIPNNYTCNDQDLGSCWWTVTLDYAGSVNDVTTWDASIQGDSVRLVE